MYGKFTTRIDHLLRIKNLKWKSIPLPPSTLDGCKRKDRYSSEQLEIIAETLQISISELTDFNGNYETMRKLLSKVDLLRKTLSEEMEDVTEKLLKNK